MAEYNMPQYILREFKVTDARVRTPESVRVLAFYSLCFIVVILAPLCFGPLCFLSLGHINIYIFQGDGIIHA